MFNNVALDVAIGLIFIYLLYSLLATIIKEFIATILSLRGKMLYKGIKRMLEDDKKGKDFINTFYSDPTIKYLTSKNSSDNNKPKKPSYLQPSTFSETLIHILRGENYNNAKSQMTEIGKMLEIFKKLNAAKLPLSQEETNIIGANKVSTQTLKQINNLYIDAQGDIDRFKNNLEGWFNDTMERTTGWYKRQVQWILLCLGFVIAVAGNVDTIKIYNILAKDKTARDQIVNMAIQSQQKYASAVDEIKRTQKDTTIAKKCDTTKIRTILLTTGDSILDKTYKSVEEDASNASSILGIGWHNSKAYKEYSATDDTLKLFSDSLKKNPKDASLSAKINSLSTRKKMLDELAMDQFNGLYSILGWLLTALALSLGAPFWFDMLNKVISLRATGAKPDDTTPYNTTNSTIKRVG